MYQKFASLELSGIKFTFLVAITKGGLEKRVFILQKKQQKGTNDGVIIIVLYHCILSSDLFISFSLYASGVEGSMSYS